MVDILTNNIHFKVQKLHTTLFYTINLVKIKFTDYVEHFVSRIVLTSLKTKHKNNLFTLKCIINDKLKTS